jgi:hypothetical protein
MAFISKMMSFEFNHYQDLLKMKREFLLPLEAVE